MKEGFRNIPELFKKAHDVHPDGQPLSVLYLYRMAVLHVAGATDQAYIPSSKGIVLGEFENNYLEKLSRELFESRRTMSFEPVKHFLQSNEISNEKSKEEKLNPEFLLLDFVFKDGILPILESKPFKREFKATKDSFYDLMDQLILTFKRSDRKMFAFNAGEVFKAKEFYMNGKTLGLGNAFILGLKNLAETGHF